MSAMDGSAIYNTMNITCLIQLLTDKRAHEEVGTLFVSPTAALKTSRSYTSMIPLQDLVKASIDLLDRYCLRGHVT